MIGFVLNDEWVTTGCAGGMPALDWIRDRAGLKGTKEGCREGDCGACTVVLGKPSPRGMDYGAVCSCLLPMAEVHRCHLVTVEGLGKELTPFQRAFYEEGASQCGFCTPGMIMSLTGFLLGNRELTEENALESLDGNICRCTGYTAVRRGVNSVMTAIPRNFHNRLEMLIEQGHVPDYFRCVPGLITSIGEREASGTGILTAGGTDLYPHPDQRLLEEEPRLVSSLGLPDSVEISDDRVIVGGAATVETIGRTPVIRGLFHSHNDFISRISSTQIRRVATLGGNIMNGSPIADLAVLFLALGATVHCGEKAVPLSEFYLGYKEFAVPEGTIITSLSFPVPPEGSQLSALKVCKREYLDIASVNSAILLTMSGEKVAGASLAAGGVAPYPLLLRKTSSFLRGRKLSCDTIDGATAMAAEEVSPISDVRGSAEYKTLLLQAQIRAHLTRGVKA